MLASAKWEQLTIRLLIRESTIQVVLGLFQCKLT